MEHADESLMLRHNTELTEEFIQVFHNIVRKTQMIFWLTQYSLVLVQFIYQLGGKKKTWMIFSFKGRF